MDFRKLSGGAGILALVIMVSSIMLPYAQAQLATTTSINNALSVTNLIVSPQPVVAGGNVTISFSLFNSYSESLSNVNLALTTPSQILNVSPSNSYLINAIGSGIYGGLGYSTFTYRLHIPSTLESGAYTIYVTASYSSSEPQSTLNVFGQSQIPITLYIYGTPQISFNIVPQSQLSQGSKFSFLLNAINTGTDTATNVTASIISTKNFNVSGQSTFNFGTISPSASSQASASVLLPGNMTNGPHNLTLRVSYRNAIRNYNYVEGVPISVPTGSPNVVASVTGAVPQVLYSGSNQTLSVLVQNIGSGTANNVTVQFGNSNAIKIRGSASSFFVGSLPQGSSVSESVLISANNSAYQNNSYVPVNISYTDANYQHITNTKSNLNVNIAPTAVFQIISVNDSLVPGGAYQPLVVTLKNVGNEAATQTTLSLQSIYPVSPIAGSAYLNYLAPGNSTEVTFYVSTDQNGKAGEFPITLYEQWKQSDAAQNQIFYGSNNYYAVVYSGAKAQGSSSSGTALEAGIVIAIIAVVAIFVLKVKKKSNKNKDKSHAKK